MNCYTHTNMFVLSLFVSFPQDNPAQRVVALQMMSHGVSTPDGNISREIQQKTASKYNLDIRNELFGVSEGKLNHPLFTLGKCPDIFLVVAVTQLFCLSQMNF